MQRVGRVELVHRPRAVGAAAQVEEARDLGERVGDRVAGVVVTEQAAIVRVVQDLVADLQVEPLGDALVEVDARAGLAGEGVLDDAFFVATADRHEVLGIFAAAAHVERHVGVHRRVAVGQRLVVERAVGVVERRNAGAEHGHGIGHRVELARAIAVREFRRAAAQTQRELRLAGAATLGGDDDDTARCFRSVDGRRRRSLQDVDILDVVRIEVGDAVDRILLVAHGDAGTRGARDFIRAGADGHVGDDDTVDDIQRLRGSENGGDAADADAIAATGGAGGLRDLRAGDLALERVLDGLRRHLVHVGPAHGGHVIGEVAARDAGGLTGDDDLIEIEHVLLEHDLEAALRRTHGDAGHRVAEAAHHEDHLAGGDVHEGERPVVTRQRTDGGAGDLQLRGSDGRS